MGRQAYTITEQDFAAAAKYIERKLKLDSSWPGSQQQAAAKAFKKARVSASAVNSWCEVYLDKRQWKKLKNAILAARKRMRDKEGEGGKPKKQVTLNYWAWRMLSETAKHEGVTLSDLIVSKLRGEWLQRVVIPAVREDSGEEE